MLIVPLVAVAAIAAAAAAAPWQAADVGRFLALVLCGLAAVEATRSVTSTRGRLIPDQLAVWCLPVAVLLPPFWALIAPIPLLALTQLRVNRADPQLRVFGAAASGLAYGAASVAFHLSVGAAGITSPGPGIGTHALTWTLLVAGCGILAWAAASGLTYLARADRPGTGRSRLLPRRDVFFADFVQLSLGVAITVVVAINPVLVIFAVPSILVQRRLLTIHSDLLDRARTDAKTGLLNFRAWEKTASSEVTRGVGTRSPLAVAIADIDHFKLINDRYGHLAGDRVLQAVAGALRTTIRPYDLAGRFGGEEFALLFPATEGAEAVRIAERLRRRVAGLTVAASERPGSLPVTVTVSVGVATLDAVGRGGEAGLTDLLAAADTALYQAKGEARNKVCLYGGPDALPVPWLETASAGPYAARA
jgi:diguanylate cyclase (GGDEF)-like protein